MIAIFDSSGVTVNVKIFSVCYEGDCSLLSLSLSL